MLNTVVDNTRRFVGSVPKTKRKQYGQFFTNAATARYMASMLGFDLGLSSIRLLDAGAGTGILSAAAVDRLLALGYGGRICLTCYETDPLVLPLLEQNLRDMRLRCPQLECRIVCDNYLTSQRFTVAGSLFDGMDGEGRQYDYIIGNPPYQKIAKDAPEAKAMGEVCHGTPNLYFLFWAMGIHNLRREGELVYIIPRSWTSGAYFRRFRHYLLSHSVITDLHLFDSRDKVFDGESVLQETMIVKVRKSQQRPDRIRITASSTSDFSDLRRFAAPYRSVVSDTQYVYLLTDEEDAAVLERVNRLPLTLPALNLKMQTGLVVDFRTREALRDSLEEGAFPLLYAQHIRQGHVVWPVGKEGEVIKTDRRALLQRNANLLLVKRFTSKEEKRRLQCGIYLKKQFPQFDYISTQNKVNFIQCESPCLTYGLYVLLNSTLYDRYYRLLNGSTQVNSTEINQMPVPERSVIEAMGRELMKGELTVNHCNLILEKWIS